MRAPWLQCHRLRFLVPIATVAALIAPGAGANAGPAPAIPAAAAAAAKRATTAPTVVTIQFDDTYADQLRALPLLRARGMAATFYVNSGYVGARGHLSSADLHALFAAGNEIGGHTVHHANLTRVAAATARREVCADRNALLAAGFPVTSFAYPFGSFHASTERVARACGYNSARGISGVSNRGPFGETMPPRNHYATRTPPIPLSSTRLSVLKRFVTDAEAHHGGWVQFIFHRVCTGPCGIYSITLANLTALLDFLRDEVRAGRVAVRTTAQVIGCPMGRAVSP